MFLFDSSEPCLTRKKIFFQKILAFFLQFSDIIKVPGNWLLPRRPINYVGKFRSPEALAKHVPLFKNWQIRFWTGRPVKKYLAENKILLSLPPGKKEWTERKKDEITSAGGNSLLEMWLHTLCTYLQISERPIKKQKEGIIHVEKKKPKKPVAWEAIACSFSSTTSFPRPAL